MNSVFELLIKVWTGSRDPKVRLSFGFDLFFSHTLEQYNVSTDRSVRSREVEKIYYRTLQAVLKLL
jgi:hypothetical protein